MITTDNMKVILAKFLDERVIPAIPEDNSLLKWSLAGSSVLVLNRLDSYTPLLKQLGIINESNLIEPEKVNLFIDNAFNKQPEVKVNLLGVPFTFDKSDGEYLLTIINQQ